MSNLSAPFKANHFHRALSVLTKDVAEAQQGKTFSKERDEELEIISTRHLRLAKRKLFNKNRLVVLGLLVIIYLALITMATDLEMRGQVESILDARYIAAYLTNLLEWLFVTGPTATMIEHGSEISYVLELTEIERWLIDVLLALIGWGSIISIPTLLIDSFIQNASLKDEVIKNHIKDQAEKIAAARIRGRLQISYDSFNAFLTKTHDPLVGALGKSFQFSTRLTKPWALIQSGEKFNQVTSAVNQHVFMPDLANNEDYEQLLGAQRLSNNTIIILGAKPNFKFLSNPDYANEVDLTLSEMIVFIENMRERAKQVRFIICSSKDLQSLSEPYQGKTIHGTTRLTELATEIGATIVDPDEVIIKHLYNLATKHGKVSSSHHPIFIEFCGRNEAKIELYRQRLKQVLHRLHDKYPLTIASHVSDATGGIFFFGEDVEGVALARKTLNTFPEKHPHYIIFEQIERYDEVEALGFQPICIDHELSKALLHHYYFSS